jgi:Ca2+-binding EF-hand superfamily protein
MRFFRGRLLIVSLAMIHLIFGGAQLFSKDTKNTNSAPQVSQISREMVSEIPISFAELQTQIDVDKDGFVTQEEWNQFFLKADENMDKRLSFEEIQHAFRQEKEAAKADFITVRKAAFVRLDANKNGTIEFSEWPGKKRKRSFRYLDLNHDGVLSLEEFTSQNAHWWNIVFEDLDFDRNRVITRSEWMDLDSEFDRLDRNHNGGIERKEFYYPR